jgi:hypothetical protein
MKNMETNCRSWVKAFRLREQVKRNHRRFPDDFMVSQNAIPSRQHLGGFKPYVFTEQGVAMLSSLTLCPPKACKNKSHVGNKIAWSLPC